MIFNGYKFVIVDTPDLRGFHASSLSPRQTLPAAT